MKVLFITGCVYAENCNRKVFTGLDYIVGEIAERLGEICDVTIYTLTPYPGSSYIPNAKIRSYSNVQLLKYISTSDFKFYKKILKNNNSFKTRIKVLRQFLIMKDLQKMVGEEGYDIIHIHGASFGYFLSAYSAKKMTTPILYTLHGLLSFGAPDMQHVDINSERALISMLKKQGSYVTVVSQGIKDVLIEKCGMQQEKIIVINNAVHMPEPDNQVNLRDKYKLGKRKIILSVGSISTRKNQIQLIRAYNILPYSIRREYVVVLAGQDTTRGAVKKYISEHNMENDIILTGYIEKTEIASLYSIASMNVMLSVSEGFGLSMIESAAFGLPTLTFGDLDAVKDIYSVDSMIALTERTDEAVANGIIAMINGYWNKNKIKSVAASFNKTIYDKYYKTYQTIINRKSNDFSMYGLDDYMRVIQD